MPATFNQQDLAQFYGSEKYYYHWTRKLVYTDGIHFLMEHGAAWLIDVIASHQINPALNKGMLNDYQIWELKVNANKSAIVTCRADSDKKPVVTQEISFTDFPLDGIQLTLELGSVDGVNEVKVLMLPSER